MKVCQVSSCERRAVARGWCPAHYMRWRSSGDVRADVPIGATPRNPPTCTVDGCDRKTYSRGLCQMHHKRLQVHGDVRADVPPRGTPKPCSVPGCDNHSEARGWCHGHLLRWLRTGDVEAEQPLSRRRQPETCTLDGCERETNAKGLCYTHRERQRQHGDALADTPIRIATGQGSLSHGYRKVSVPVELREWFNGETQVAEHRIMMALYLGRPLHPDETVHHRNGVRTDNRIDNLELWSTAHGKGQRIEDKVAFAIEMLRRYRPDALRETDMS